MFSDFDHMRESFMFVAGKGLRFFTVTPQTFLFYLFFFGFCSIGRFYCLYSYSACFFTLSVC